MSESSHEKLKRVRKPRVHITYDVETEGAEARKELPFNVGVMADLTGNNPAEKQKPLKDRKFIQIDRDNFDAVMERLQPGVSMKVDNVLDDKASEMQVDLTFTSMDDFEPENIVKKVEPLQKLLDARNKLRDLLSKADRSDDLENLLEKVLKNTSDLQYLAEELEKID